MLLYAPTQHCFCYTPMKKCHKEKEEPRIVKDEIKKIVYEKIRPMAPLICIETLDNKIQSYIQVDVTA